MEGPPPATCAVLRCGTPACNGGCACSDGDGSCGGAAAGRRWSHGSRSGGLAASPNGTGLPARGAAARRPPLSAGGGGASFLTSGSVGASASSAWSSSYVSGSPSWGRPRLSGGGRGGRGGGHRSRRGGRYGGGGRRAGGAGCGGGDLTAVWLAAVAHAADSTEFGDDPWGSERLPTPTAASPMAASPHTPAAAALSPSPPAAAAGGRAAASSGVGAASPPTSADGWSDWGTLDAPPSPPAVAGAGAGASLIASRGVPAARGTPPVGSTPPKGLPANAGGTRLSSSTAAAGAPTRGGASPPSPDTPVRVWVRPQTKPVEVPLSSSGGGSDAVAVASAVRKTVPATEATLTQPLPPPEVVAAAAGRDGDGVAGGRDGNDVPDEMDTYVSTAASSPPPPGKSGLVLPSLAQGPIVHGAVAAPGGGGDSRASLPAVPGTSSPPPLARGPIRGRGGVGSVSFVDGVGGGEQAVARVRPSLAGPPPSLARGPIGPAATHGSGSADGLSSDSGSIDSDLSPPPLSQGAVGKWPPPRPPPMALGWAARGGRPATDVSRPGKDIITSGDGEQGAGVSAPAERSPPKALGWAARGGMSAAEEKVHHPTEDDGAETVGRAEGAVVAGGVVIATNVDAAAQQSPPHATTRSPIAGHPASVDSSAEQAESVEAVDWPSPRYPSSSQDAPSSNGGGTSTELRSPSFRASGSPRRASSASRFSSADPASGGQSLSTTPPSAAWRLAHAAAEGEDTSTPPLSEAVRPLLPRPARRFAAAPAGAADGERGGGGAGGRQLPSAPVVGSMVIVRDAATAANVPPEDWGASEARPWPAPKMARPGATGPTLYSPPAPQTSGRPAAAAGAAPPSSSRSLSIEDRLAAIPAFSPPLFLPPAATAAATKAGATEAVGPLPLQPSPRVLPQLSLPRPPTGNTAPDFLTTAVELVVPPAGDGGVGIVPAGGGRRTSTHQRTGLAATAAGRDVLVTWRPRALATREAVAVGAADSDKEEMTASAEPAAELVLTAHRERVVDVEWLEAPPAGGLHVLATAAADAAVILWVIALAAMGPAARPAGDGGRDADAHQPPPLRILRRYTILPVRRQPDDYYVRLRLALRPAPAGGGIAFVLVLVPSSGTACPPRVLRIVVTSRGEWSSAPSPRRPRSPRSAVAANRPRRWILANDAGVDVQEGGGTLPSRPRSPPSPPPDDAITPVSATTRPPAEEVVTPAVAAEVLALPRATTYPLNPSADTADFPVESDIAIAAWEAATTPTTGVETSMMPGVPEGGGGWAWAGYDQDQLME